MQGFRGLGRGLQTALDGLAERGRAGVALQVFRHQPPAGEMIGHGKIFHVRERLDEPGTQQRNLVGHHHRPLEQHGLERGRAGGQQHDVGGAHRLARMAVQARDRQVPGVLPFDGVLEDHARAAIHEWRDEMQLRVARMQPLGGAHEQYGMRLELAYAAAGQERDYGFVAGQLQLLAQRGPIHLAGDFIGQRVADECRRHLVLLVELRFEREQRQHPIDRAPDLAHPVAAPGPDLRTDILDGRNAGALQALGQPQVEPGRIDADEQIGRIGDKMPGQVATDAQQLEQSAGDLGHAQHRQRLDRHQALAALGDHERPAHALETDARQALAQLAQQPGAQLIAGHLAGDHRNS
ncbi:MAG: hypothetical protein A2V91_04285 [Candidatus Muproteobacteria bacterium RBG_16_64_10]|uniref:Uncharacterized protein n=1 Tax=Candidatus Muproteobacteria bacterium RBG_16_64_10 TaxID=1817757 RepID=A0A1F6SWC7_9PROT|nr:MAG: hypothetical protein A2V91_04285 [Candidatus Muproteobacteria bacterium RBG_16_64_10]